MSSMALCVRLRLESSWRAEKAHCHQMGKNKNKSKEANEPKDEEEEEENNNNIEQKASTVSRTHTR